MQHARLLAGLHAWQDVAVQVALLLQRGLRVDDAIADSLGQVVEFGVVAGARHVVRRRVEATHFVVDVALGLLDALEHRRSGDHLDEMVGGR